MADPASESTETRLVITRSEAMRFVVPLVGAVIAPLATFVAYLFLVIGRQLSFAVIAVAIVVLLGLAAGCGYVTESLLSAVPPTLTATFTLALLIEWETTAHHTVGWMALVLVGALALTVAAAAVGKRISRRTRRIEWRSVNSERY